MPSPDVESESLEAIVSPAELGMGMILHGSQAVPFFSEEGCEEIQRRRAAQGS